VAPRPILIALASLARVNLRALRPISKI